MKTIRIKEALQIPGTDVLLEEGDVVKVRAMDEMITYNDVEAFAKNMVSSLVKGNIGPRELGANIGENLAEELIDAMTEMEVTGGFRDDFVRGFKDAIRKEL